MAAEAKVEKYLCDQINEAGGLCLKLAIIGKRNFPDRTCLLHGGIIFFVECKHDKSDLRKSQAWFKRLLERLGFRVYVAKNKKDVDQIIAKEMDRP